MEQVKVRQKPVMECEMTLPFEVVHESVQDVRSKVRKYVNQRQHEITRSSTIE